MKPTLVYQIIIGIAVLCWAYAQDGGAPGTCAMKPTDLVFVLDSSTSLGVDNFNMAKDLVTNVVTGFDVGPKNLKVGLVTYTSTGNNEFYLNTHTDKTSLLSAIRNVQFRSGTSATSQGLRQVDYFQFVPYSGSRMNSRKMVILLTDGRSDDQSATVNQAYQLKHKGIEIVTIGLGPSVSQYELSSVASDASHSLVLNSADAMATVGEKVKAILCNNSQQLTDTTTDCGHKMVDIVFVLDSSASEGGDNFRRQVDFVRDIVSQFTIGPRDTQVSLVLFSSSVHEEFSLARWSDKQSILNAVGSVTYLPGSTKTDTALNYVRQYSFTPAKGGRGDAKKLAIVITDGRSSDPRQTSVEANLLKNVADVISIGIGVGVDQAELQSIATDRNHTLPIANFDALQMIKKKLTQMVCQNSVQDQHMLFG